MWIGGKCVTLRHKPPGALAHLARAFDWQSRGDQFESGMLHKFSCFLNVKGLTPLQGMKRFLFLGTPNRKPNRKPNDGARIMEH